MKNLSWALAVALNLTAGMGHSQQLDKIEGEFWEFAMSTGSVDGFETFIATFPKSELLPQAKQMLEDLKDDARRRKLESEVFEHLGVTSFDQPMNFGNEHTIGRSIKEIITSTPAFPPIEGLPESVWKEKKCSSCHQWTQANLCAQSKTYISKKPEKYQDKQHPFGGMLKINLRNWAKVGCS